MESKTCIACGMPMKEATDFAQHDRSKDYCTHCARPDGSMQSFDEKREGLTNFMMQTQGIDKSAAQAAAEAMMKHLPAWQAHFAG